MLFVDPPQVPPHAMADAGNYYNTNTKEAKIADEVHDYLAQLDALRQESERRGDFLKAHACVDRMREVNLRFAKRLEQKSHQANVDSKTRVAETHEAELLTFTRIWEDKLRDYDQQSGVILDELKVKHTMDYQGQEGILKVQLMNKRPRFSRAVMDLRNRMEHCVSQRNYLEAEVVKKKLVSQENMEVAAFDDSLAATFNKRTVVLKSQYVNELRAVEQKIGIGREELLTARKIEFDVMMRRHRNVCSELDQDTKLHISKTRQYIHRQVKALVQDPVKTAMELRGVAATMRDGQGKKLRARTPPATARRQQGPGAAASYGRAAAGNSSARGGGASWVDDDDTRYGY
jgi:hypothetical protein